MGPIVQWASSLLLLGVFALLLPLTSQRRVVQTWMIAWVAQLAWVTWTALIMVMWLLPHHGDLPTQFSLLQTIYWPARFILVAAIGLGALEASRWRFSVRRRNAIFLTVAFASVMANLLPHQHIVVVIETFATILVLFGSVECVVLHAEGVRRRGLLFLASSLTLYGIISTLYLASNFTGAATGFWSRLLNGTWLSSGYGDAAALAILACSVIVVIVQEAFIDARESDGKRIVAATQAEGRLHGIIQATREAIVMVDASERIRMLNGSAEILFGQSADKLIGSPLADSVPGISASPVVETSARMSGVPMQSGDVRRPDGSTVPVEYTVGPIRDDNAAGTVIVLRDISARRAAEVERDAFERRAAENDKMVAIGRVVSGVAHELNNPLAVVLGQSEQLVERAPTAELQAGLTLIHEQAHRARRIVRDLLAFVRHREGGSDTVVVSRLVERVIVSQRNNASVHGVTLDASSACDFTDVRVDRNTAEQVLVNLVTNAIDAAGDGGTVRVICSRSDEQLHIAVEDSGPGVADELTSRIFEPFFTTKEPGRGTGLGLSVSQGLAEQQGGGLHLENRPAPGVGARMVLSLPGVTSDVVPAPSAMTTFPAPPWPGAGAMVIDDERSVRMTLTRMFRRAGWSTQEAAGGDEATKWLATVPRDEAPAVILCDLKMPGMNGDAVHRQCAQSRPELARRFIFVTGDVLGSARDSFAQETRQEMIEKPFTIAEIAGAVERTVSSLEYVAQ